MKPHRERLTWALWYPGARGKKHAAVVEGDDVRDIALCGVQLTGLTLSADGYATESNLLRALTCLHCRRKLRAIRRSR